jgi:hypothetical protein
MKHGQKTLETFMKTPVSHGLKQTVRSHTPPTPPDRQDDQTNKNNGSKKPRCNNCIIGIIIDAHINFYLTG